MGHFQKIRGRIPYVFWVMLQTVGLPLVLAAFGYLGWAAYEEDIQWLESGGAQQQIRAIEEALTFVKSDPKAQIEIDGTLYSGSKAAFELRRMQSDAQQHSRKSLSTASLLRAQMASIVAIFCGVVASVLGVLGMLGVYASGRSAMRSRDALLQSFSRWVGLLPLYLGTLLLLLAVGYAALTVVRTYSSIDVFMNRSSSGAVKFSVVVWMMAATMAFYTASVVWRLRRSLASLQAPVSQVTAQALTATEAPGLWAHVAKVAKTVGAPLPANIVVGMEESFYVTAHSMELLPSQQLLTGHTLHLPLTYLTLLRRDEIDAILAHELGHFAGEDTQYSSRFSPLYGGMIDALERMEGDGKASLAITPAVYFSHYLLQRFDLAVKHWSRVREFAADAVSARIGGAEASARALVHVSALAPRIHERVSEMARRPDEAGNDLIGMLGESVRQSALEVPDFDAESATVHPHDTHPPTLERLKALGVAPSPALIQAALSPPDESGLAWVRSLFLDSDALQNHLLSHFKSASREQNEATRQMLQSVTAQVSGRHEFRDSRRGLIVSSAMAFLFLSLFAAVCYAGTRMDKGQAALWVMGCLFGGAGLFFSDMAVNSAKRRKQLIMEISPSGFRVNGIQEEISWGSVEDYSGSLSYGFVGLVFTLEPHAPSLTRLSGPIRLGYKPKKRRLWFALQGVEGKTPGDFFELIGKYRHAWHAQAALDEM